jgi:hypothetical protein
MIECKVGKKERKRKERQKEREGKQALLIKQVGSS